jgi:hypothetical protein
MNILKVNSELTGTLKTLSILYEEIQILPLNHADAFQIGFLTEWQMYAQKLEGDTWLGERMDPAKVEKMSGLSCYLFIPQWHILRPF